MRPNEQPQRKIVFLGSGKAESAKETAFCVDEHTEIVQEHLVGKPAVLPRSTKSVVIIVDPEQILAERE